MNQGFKPGDRCYLLLATVSRPEIALLVVRVGTSSSIYGIVFQQMLYSSTLELVPAFSSTSIRITDSSSSTETASTDSETDSSTET